MLTALLSGLGLGFVGSMPIAGPTAVVVVDSGLENRPMKGLYVAIGAAAAESLYAALAFWGLTTLFALHPLILPASRVFGGAVLILIGLYFLRRRASAKAPARQREPRQGKHLVFGFSMTLFNPALAATWAAAIAALHSAFPETYKPIDALPFGLGAAIGIVAWFWLLLKLVHRFREKVRPKTVNALVRGMGGALVILGFLLAARTILPML